MRVPVAVFRKKNSPLTTLFSSFWRLIRLASEVSTIGSGLPLSSSSWSSGVEELPSVSCCAPSIVMALSGEKEISCCHGQRFLEDRKSSWFLWCFSFARGGVFRVAISQPMSALGSNYQIPFFAFWLKRVPHHSTYWIIQTKHAYKQSLPVNVLAEDALLSIRSDSITFRQFHCHLGLVIFWINCPIVGIAVRTKPISCFASGWSPIWLSQCLSIEGSIPLHGTSHQSRSRFKASKRTTK
jgi:hypothetical protein